LAENVVVENLNVVISINRQVKMRKIRLSEDEFKDKVLGCWLGKNIGGTLGTPYEGKKYVHNLTFYDPVPKEPLANDDLDFQLVWLKMLEDRGIDVSFSDFTDYWMKYLSGHWYNEYSFCTYNLQRGLKPPISGAFQNYYVDEMGSPIRSEIWACLSPADPQLAARMAWMDSSLDHTGGEGRWGEMFWASVESAAFVIKDIKALVQIGLSMIPISCNISRVIREVLYCHETGMRWDEVRERVVTIFGHYQPCNAIPNHGFTIIGLLYGEDFGDKLCKSVNCAYDTDCTGATLGSLLGIIHGASSIPINWRRPVGNAIVPCKQTVTEGLPKTLNELTQRSIAIAKNFISRKSETVEFADDTSIPENVFSLLCRNDKVRELLTYDDHCAIENIDDLEVVFHYNGEPVVFPGIKRTYKISLNKDESAVKGSLIVKGPVEWEISNPLFKEGHYIFDIIAKRVENHNKIEVTAKFKDKVYKTNFTLLGHNAIKGIPATAFPPKDVL